MPPIFTEPGWNLHTAAEIGIDDFQSTRSPDERYRTTPLAGLFTRQKGGFYHDGRFADLRAVVEHYNRTFSLNLSDRQKRELIEYPVAADHSRCELWNRMDLRKHWRSDEVDRTFPRGARSRGSPHPRALEKVPTGRDDWAPHPKSMRAGAGLPAMTMPSWISLIIDQDELNLTPPPGASQYQQPAVDKLAEVHDANVAKGRAAFSKTNDDYSSTNWRLIAEARSSWNSLATSSSARR